VEAAQAALIACLDEMGRLARKRAEEWPDGYRHEQYERIASIIEDHKQTLTSQNFPHMGTGAGLGLSKGLGEWGFPENGDQEMIDLAYKADALHLSGELS
jgi:hypothetical protein